MNTLNREEAKQLLANIEVVKAWAAGKTIQFRKEGTGEWRNAMDAPMGFIYPKEPYRIKPREALAVYKSDAVGPVGLFSTRFDADAYIRAEERLYRNKTNAPTFEVVTLVEAVK